MTDSKLTLYVLCGLPGSGKSTLAARLAVQHSALVVTADEIRAGANAYRVIERMRAQLRLALANGQSVVVDSCALRRHERGALRDIGRAAAARCELIVLRAGWRLCHARNVERAAPARIDWLPAAALLADALATAQREHWDLVRTVEPGGVL